MRALGSSCAVANAEKIPGWHELFTAVEILPTFDQAAELWWQKHSSDLLEIRLSQQSCSAYRSLL